MKNFSKSLIALALSTASLSALSANFSGQVKDENGQPIKGADVIIHGSNLKVSTDAQGKFTLTNVKPGHYHIHFSSPQHQSKELDIEFGEDDLVKEIVLPESLIENIVVYASALNHSTTLESASPITVVAGDELRARQANTLGETLNGIPGVHSSHYGPVASSPIIRGFDGPRVKITQNGLTTGDVSRTGPDHYIGAESATATQVEILRGPASLLFGSGAIGGVVNVVDNRIPQAHEEELNGAVDARFDTVSDGKTASFDINGDAGDFAWHFDGFKRDTNDFHIPGEASLHDEHEEDHDDHEEEHHEDEHHEDEHGESSSDRLANSSIDASGFTLGTSYIFDQGFFGISYSRLDNTYGIPGHSHGHEEEHDDHEGEHDDHEGEHDDHEDEHEEHEEEVVFADLEQDTWQLSGSFAPKGSIISRVDVRAAYSDYEHIEFEDYEAGTTFTNESWELRNDYYHAPIGEWQGVFGVHLSSSDFEATGEEAFTPPSKTDTFALYLVEEREFEDFTVSLGARYERVGINPTHTEHEEEHDDHEDEHHEDEHGDDEHHDEEHEAELRDVDYNALSLSAGIVAPINDDSSIALSYSYSERAPATSELYSNGAHIATSTFELGGQYDVEIEDDGHVHVELGNNDMSEESSHNIDITYRKYGGSWGATVSVFYNQTSDFTYLADLGFTADMISHEEHEEHDDDHDVHEEEHNHGSDLPVYQYLQEDATIYGLEALVTVPFADQWQLDLTMDYTRGKLDDAGDLPRMPPLRLGSKLNWFFNNWHADVEATWYDKQDKTAEYESETDGYTIVNTSVDYRMNDFLLYLKVENMFDEEARVHTSFVKDEAPMAGRNYQFGVRYEF